jgi:hypothetical protein
LVGKNNQYRGFVLRAKGPKTKPQIEARRKASILLSPKAQEMQSELDFVELS